MQDLCAYEVGLIHFCPFEAAILQSVQSVALGYSSFCDLFTESDWEAYEYWYGEWLRCVVSPGVEVSLPLDLAFWYSDGPGGGTTAAQGIGYVQEVIARLTQTPITAFDTTTNATLDGSNITFPLNQPIFVDASHDTVISSSASSFTP